MSRNKPARLYVLALFAAAGCVVATEVTRHSHPTAPFIVYPVVFIMVSFASILTCTTTANTALRRTPFWWALTYVELTFVCLSIARIYLVLHGQAESPLYSGFANAVVLAVTLALLVFRYVAYQSVWMSWAGPEAKENLLNKHLVASLKERDTLLQRLAVSHRRLGVSTLASSLAHQLSQPLTGAAVRIDTIKREMTKHGSDPEAREGVEQVAKLLGRLSMLVRDLRSLFSESKTSRQEIRLSDMLNEILELIRHSEKASGVVFEMSGDVNELVYGNLVQVQQVVLNIVDNALQALASAPGRPQKIDIAVVRHNRSVSISFRDSGTGFSDDVLPKAFDLYRTTKEAGTGIGLWLSRQIIERHKGSIWASNAPGGGAVVVMTLPLAGVDP